MAKWNVYGFYESIAAGEVDSAFVASQMADPEKADAVVSFSPGFNASFDRVTRQWVGPEAALMAAHCSAFEAVDMDARTARQRALLDRVEASTASFDAMVGGSKGSIGQSWENE